MKLRTTIKFSILALLICLVIGISTFMFNAFKEYKINKGFEPLPLVYDANNSASEYKTQDIDIIVHDGFVKGIQSNSAVSQSIVIRALAPLPSVTVKAAANAKISLMIENINPDLYIGCINKNNMTVTKVSANTLKFDFEMSGSQTADIKPVLTADKSAQYKYVILGDNRDGYDTFGQIIDQINGIKPAFVIDNGDLVYSSKANQYRLFDQMVSKISATLCTTPGNHDIRRDGRAIYTMLYGPANYSFDFQDSHFVFIDSSAGWAEKRAISDEQYAWLVTDLKKADGKKIYVITHIPPTDPRSNVTANEVPQYINQEKSGNSWIEQKISDYAATKDMAHGFADPAEAAKFEKIMSDYHVSLVYLSHIHSYFDYYKDGVRYIITGGAGAELLTANSYYHYIIAQMNNADTNTMVQLPSPTNKYVSRYAATIQLFYYSLYKENPVSVIFIISGLIILLLLLIVRFYIVRKQQINTFGNWLKDVGKYGKARFIELFGRRNKKKK